MKHIRIQAKHLLVPALLVLLAACGGTGTDDTLPEPPSMSISVSADRTTVASNQAVTLEATIDGTGATADHVRWSAEDDHGTFSADSGLEVTWTAPTEEGAYTISAELTVNGESISDTVTIDVTNTLGSLEIQISGLPDVDAAVTVNSGGDEIADLTESATLSDLEPGDYTVSAADIVDGHLIYTATVAPPGPVSVEAGATAGPVVVDYALSPTVMVVTETDDLDEPGSLRYLLDLAAQPDSNIDTIEFSPSLISPGISPTVLQLAEQLTVPAGLQLTLAGLTEPHEDQRITSIHLRADDNSRVLHVEEGAVVELRDLLLTGGDISGRPGDASEQWGGGIYNEGDLSLHNVDVAYGMAAHGGGIYSSGSLTFTNGYIIENSSTGGGGGLYLESGSEAAIANSTIQDNETGDGIDPRGGGILIQNDVTFELRDSTVRGNRAHGNGGGIGAWNDNAVTISGSTFTGNTADTGRGGGIWGNASSRISVINSTFTGNSAGTNGGAIGVGNNLALWFSTVVGNTSGTFDGNRIGGISANANGVSMVGSLVAGNETVGLNAVIDLNLNAGASSEPIEYNVVGRADQVARGLLDASGTNFWETGLGLDPELDPLADNGGPTETMLPQAGARALDFVPAAYCLDLDYSPLTVDQRGAPRPSGTQCDAGAVELQ